MEQAGNGQAKEVPIHIQEGLNMPIKERRHPEGCIDLSIVPFSMVIEGKLLDAVNKEILKKYGSEYLIPTTHHILLVDMGEIE